MNGIKDKEYRTISDTTVTRYIENERVDGKLKLFYNHNLISDEKLQQYGIDIHYYNDGVFPFIPKNITRLDLGVGNQKDRDTMTVEVTDISFEPGKNKEGNVARISFDEEDKPSKDMNGDFTIWNIVFHLGEVVERDLKGEK